MAAARDLEQQQCEQATQVCACLHVRRAARAVTRLFDDVLQPSGLRSTQFVILATLRARGEQALPALARELSTDRSSLGRGLQHLEADGLVRRIPGRTGRASRVGITAKGRRWVSKAIPLWQQAQARYESALGGAGWDELRDGLDRATVALDG